MQTSKSSATMVELRISLSTSIGRKGLLQQPCSLDMQNPASYIMLMMKVIYSGALTIKLINTTL